jgi:LemA protein
MTITSIIIAFILIWLVYIYNRFIKQKNIVKEAWSGIDVQLKRRYDLIPNLVDTVKGYSGYEKELMQDITELRAKSMQLNSPGEKVKPESDLSGRLKTLLAVAENYPDLKASSSFLNLQQQLTEVEDQIQYARRYYNGAVRDYNTLIQSFPANILASAFRFRQEEFFEITLATERETPQVGLA